MFGLAPLIHVPKLVYLGTANDTTDLTTYTFSSQPLGKPSTLRTIVVATSSRDATASTISAATIAGVTATVAVLHSTASLASALLVARVPTGTAGTVSITWNSGVSRCWIGLYAIYGLASIAPHDTGSGGSNFSLSVPGNGIVICSASHSTTMTFVGVSEDAQSLLEAGTQHGHGSASFVPQNAALTVGGTADSQCAASFR